MTSDNKQSSGSSRSSGRDLRREEAYALLGQIINDRYRIEQIVGIGGVGTVYRATQLGLDRRVAIKILRPELLKNKTALARFTREARVAANLQHPNIVTVHDFGTMADGRAFIVMEFLHGLDLAQWIRTQRPTDVRVGAGYLRSVCDAVGALHRSGIIHRDIKPSNVMIATQPSGGGIVKIVDFGFVRPGISDEAGDLTGGLVVGTPEFMSPELFSGGKPNVASDIYAIGVTAYETFTGTLPFGLGSFREMFLRHSRDIPAAPTALRPDLPPVVDSIVLRALNKDPKRRYATAEDFGIALEGLADPEGGARQTQTPLEYPGGDFPFDECETKLASILFVEDDTMVRDVIVPELERHAFDVVTASDGIEAFILLGSRRFDIIVSDLAMPNLDGMSLLRLKSEKGIGTPVIFLTGSMSEHDEELAASLGASGFVRKPPRVDELLGVIHDVLGIG
jgi:CheY-like chemotaxis protein